MCVWGVQLESQKKKKIAVLVLFDSYANVFAEGGWHLIVSINVPACHLSLLRGKKQPDS